MIPMMTFDKLLPPGMRIAGTLHPVVPVGKREHRRTACVAPSYLFDHQQAEPVDETREHLLGFERCLGAILSMNSGPMSRFIEKQGEVKLMRDSDR